MWRIPIPSAVLFCVSVVSCATPPGGRPKIIAPGQLSRIEVFAQILVLEDARSLGGGLIQTFLRMEDPAIRRRAAVAAGRIGDPLVVPQLLLGLTDVEAAVRREAAFALGLIGDPEGAGALITALRDPDPLVRGRASEALSRTPEPPTTTASEIAEAFRRALPRTSGEVLRIRGDNPEREDDPWIEPRLHLLALARLKHVEGFKQAVLGSDGQPIIDWWVSVWAAMRIAAKGVLPVLMAGAAAEDPYIRALAARGLGALKDRMQIQTLGRLVEERAPGVVREGLRGLVALGVAEGAARAATHLESPDLTLRREALLALAALPPDPRWRTRVMDNLGHPDPWIRSAAWPALIAIDAEDIGMVLSTVGRDDDWRVLQSVASALARTLGERATPLLVPMLDGADARVVPTLLSALVTARGREAVPVLLDHLEHPSPGVRVSAVENLASLDAMNDPRVEGALFRALESSAFEGDISDARISLVDAIAKNPGEKARALLRRITATDPARVVRQRALAALGGGFSSPEETAIRSTDARRLVSIFGPGAELRYSPRVVVSTRRGRIELVLDMVNAPLTSMSFVRLAQAGFFNGLTFHLVVPGFVVQGGDPRGEGSGGSGTTLRCEYSGRPFGRGAVGMAHSGKDTAESQFFITLEPQPQLDGSYTQFGQVLSGLDVVDRIRPGDLIERIDVFDGREVR